MDFSPHPDISAPESPAAPEPPRAGFLPVAGGAPAPALSNVVLNMPASQTAALVFASPHSGQNYPADFLAAARLDPHALRRSEDCFVDELFDEAPARGAPLLSATFPRAFCDPNREAWELDPSMFLDALPDWVNTASPRVAAGLGTVARVVASGEPIYRDRLTFAEARERVRLCWQPFHDRLRETVESTRARFGHCLLIDCHSMPANSMAPKTQVDFILGDAHGTTCAPAATRLVERALNGMGYTVRRNDPYAGGYITRHYGRPREGVQAIQIEINRALYMDEARLERLPRFGRLKRDLTALIEILAEHAGKG